MSNYSYKTLADSEVHRRAKPVSTVGAAQWKSGKENIHADVKRLKREEMTDTCSDAIVLTGGWSQERVGRLQCCDSGDI